MTERRWRRGKVAVAVSVGVSALAVVTQAFTPPAGAAQRSSVGLTVPSAGYINTVAGGAGGPARAALIPFYSPRICGTVQYAANHLYIADQTGGVVRSVNVRTDWLATVAGYGLNGYDGDGGRATQSLLSVPCAATIDYAGNVVIADNYTGRIRVVAATTGTFYGQSMVAGHIYTVMKGAAPCRPGATGGRFCPVDVLADHSGNVLVSNAGTPYPHPSSPRQIIVIAARSGTFYGRAMTAGQHYLLADAGGAQLAVDRSGNIVAGQRNAVIVVAERTGRFYGRAMRAGSRYVIAGRVAMAGDSGDGGPATKALLSSASGVALDHVGNVMIADTNNDQIRVVAERTGRFYGMAMTAGDIYTIAGRRLGGRGGSGVPARDARLVVPHSVTVDGWGNVVICDGNDRARVIAAQTGRFYGKAMRGGDIYSVAGSRAAAPFSAEGGLATRAQLSGGGIAVDKAGNLLLTDYGRLRVVAAADGTFYGRAMSVGHIYTIAGGGSGGGSDGLGDGGPAIKAKLGAMGVAVDGAGNIVLTDTRHQRVRVVAVRAGTFYGQAMKAGYIYAVAGDGAAGFAGDGGPAASSELSNPTGVAVDHAGNLVIADVSNSRVRVVAGAAGTFYGVQMTKGDIYTVAGTGGCLYSGDGGPATAAHLCFVIPTGIAVDHKGNIVLSDPMNSRVRVIAGSSGIYYGQSMTAGDIYTVAGNGNSGPLGDGGPATAAELYYPAGVAVDGAGNVLIADSVNSDVRVVAATSGTFYGVAMTAGDIYRVAGRGSAGLGDGGPAIGAELPAPDWVAVDALGNLLVDASGRVRIVGG